MHTSEAHEAISQQLINAERLALSRWCHGDPSGFLELSAGDVVYLDPFIPTRLDGLPALRDYYESLRGKVYTSRFELHNPFVQVLENAAVLTYHFVAYGDDGDTFPWNCTEVFRLTHGEWKIVHTHWSFTATAHGNGAAH